MPASEAIILKPGLGPFNRSVRDAEGKIVRTINFQPGIPVDLNDSEVDACANDIGNTLVFCTVDEAGFKIDIELTQQVVLAIARQHLESKKELTPAQKLAIENAKVAPPKPVKVNPVNDEPGEETDEAGEELSELEKIDAEIEALETASETLIVSLETAADEDKEAIEKQLEDNRAFLVELNANRDAAELAAWHAELVTLEASIVQEGTSAEDVADAKKRASVIKGKITRANKANAN